MRSEPAFRGVYINLERSKKRQAFMEAQLRKLMLQEHCDRFSAIDGRKLEHFSSHLVRGEVACFMSHLEALRSLIKYRKCGHVLEDDTELTSYIVPIMTTLIHNGIFDGFDIVFSDIILVPDPNLVSYFSDILGGNTAVGTRQISDFTIVDLKGVNFSGANSYFVGSQAIERVVDILHAEVRDGPTIPIDLCLNKNIREGVIRAACIVPFITRVDVDIAAESEIEGRKRQFTDKVIAMDLLRELFFVNTHFDQRLSSLLNRLTGKNLSVLSHREYLNAILEKLKSKPVME